MVPCQCRQFVSVMVSVCVSVGVVVVVVASAGVIAGVGVVNVGLSLSLSVPVPVLSVSVSLMVPYQCRQFVSSSRCPLTNGGCSLVAVVVTVPAMVLLVLLRVSEGVVLGLCCNRCSCRGSMGH